MLSAFLAMIDSESGKTKFRQIYEKYKSRVYNLAYKYLNDRQYAEDATQETFFRIAKNIEDYHDIDSDETDRYVYVTARYAAIYIYNKYNKVEENLLPDHTEIVDVQASDTSADDIVDAIKGLGSKYSDVLLLKYKFGYSVQEISEILGLSEDTVRGRLSRGRKMLANNYCLDT